MLKPFTLLHRLPSSFIRRIPFTKMTASLSPGFPNFVSVEGTDFSSTSKVDGIRFRIVSYNILAQAYVKSALFPHSPSPCLKWKARSQSILTILRDLEADFLCLQELDEYDSFYKGNMETHGYSSIYIQRSGQKRDGCGIFYKDNCAELLIEEQIAYNDLVDLIPDHETKIMDGDKEADSSLLKSSPQARGDPNDLRVRLKRDCVGIMAAFRLKDHIVIVANTHIYWDPEWADVKLAQSRYLLSRLAHFKITVSDMFNCTPSVFIAGDFNSTPGDKVYQYILSGNQSFTPLIESLEEAPVPLRSVYEITRGEPPFTNCTPDFTNTLDYIFFSPSDSIKPVSFLELPQPDSPDILGGLPNYSHPSDHLPIGAEFEISRV